MKLKTLFVLLLLVVIITSCKKEQELGNTDIVDETKTTQTETKETGTQGGDAGSFFNKITGSPEYKVKYNMKTTSEGDTTEAVQTMVIKGQNIKIEFETEQGNVASYVVDKKTYSCTEAEGNVMCFELPTEETDNNNVETGTDIRENWQDYNLVPSGVKTIAGTVATCFNYNIMTQGKAEYCFSAEGVPLFMRIESDKHVTEMTAVEYKSSVSDSEFTLPAVPQKMPTY